ncbi:SE1832 family protein [Robertmurraya sp. Marseille-Q9965]
MERKEIEYKIQDLKMEYVRLQNDLEKLESVHGNLSPLERQISQIETDLKELYKQLDYL